MAGMTVALGMVYRYGPDREDPRWDRVSVGAVIAAGHVDRRLDPVLHLHRELREKYNETYGSLGAVVVLLLWPDLTAFAVVPRPDQLRSRTADGQRQHRRPDPSRSAHGTQWPLTLSAARHQR